MSKLLAAGVLVLVLPALGLGQSLGAAAQKEKERRKKNQETGVKAKVMTDEDVAAVHQDAPATAASPSPRPSLFASPQDDTRSEGGSDRVRKQQETRWRERMAQANARLERARKRYETLSQMYLAQGEYFADEKGRAVISSAEQLQRLTAQAKAELEAAQKAIDNLEDEARRAGVPPGWLR